MPNRDPEIMPSFEKFNELDVRRRQKKTDADTVKNAHVQVLQIIRLAEKDRWMPTDTAQRIVDFLAQQIMENRS